MSTESDDQLVDRLRAIAGVTDPVPAHVDEAARAALSTRHLDELARLLADSDDGAAVLTRGTGEIRLLSFGTAAVALELQVSIDGETATVRGLLTGAPGPVTVEVRDGAELSAPVDDGGYFTVRGVPLTLVRLRAGATTTEWFTP